MNHPDINQPTEWERARNYLEWAIRQGFSKETMLLIPHHPLLTITKQERKIIRGLIIKHFKTLGE